MLKIHGLDISKITKKDHRERLSEFEKQKLVKYPKRYYEVQKNNLLISVMLKVLTYSTGTRNCVSARNSQKLVFQVIIRSYEWTELLILPSELKNIRSYFCLKNQDFFKQVLGNFFAFGVRWVDQVDRYPSM